eukprot:468001_1
MAQERKRDDNEVADFNSRRVTLGNDPSLTMPSDHRETPGGNIAYFSNRSRDSSRGRGHHVRRGGYHGGSGYYASGNLTMRRASGSIGAADNGNLKPFQNLWTCKNCGSDNWINGFNVTFSVEPCHGCGRAGVDFVWGRNEVVQESLIITGRCDLKRKEVEKRLVDVENFDEKNELSNWDRLNDKKVLLKSEVSNARMKVADAKRILSELESELSGCVSELNECEDNISYTKEKRGWRGNLEGVKSHLLAQKSGIGTEESLALRLMHRNVSDVVAKKSGIFVWHKGRKILYHNGKSMGLVMNDAMKTRNWLYVAKKPFRDLATNSGAIYGILEACNVGYGEGNVTIRLENRGNVQEQRAWSLVKWLREVVILSADCTNKDCVLDVSASVGVKIVATAAIGGNYNDRAEAHEVFAAKGCVIYGEIKHVCGIKII